MGCRCRDRVQPQLSLSIVPCSLSCNEKESEGHAVEVDEHDVVASGERKTTVLQR